MTLDQAESSLLASLVGQVIALLADGSTEVDRPASDADPLQLLEASLKETPEAPDDPILARLLPDAYRDDSDAAEEFRRLTDGDLRATKRAALDRVRRDLAAAEPQGRSHDVRIDLDEPATVRWLHALADVRLALGTRLEVTEQTELERRGSIENSPDAVELAVYDWLTWLQDAVVRQAPV